MVEDIQHQILHYLLRYPEARDSAEGIMTWWLSPGASVTLPEVEDALSELVRLRWVNRAGEGDVQLFGLEAAATDEIESYLHRGLGRG